MDYETPEVLATYAEDELIAEAAVCAALLVIVPPTSREPPDGEPSLPVRRPSTRASDAGPGPRTPGVEQTPGRARRSRHTQDLPPTIG